MSNHESVLLDKIRLMFASPGGDVTHAQEIYHEDAVLEFPQSGERFEGRNNFTQWRSQYPAEVSYQVRRITVRDDLVVAEGTVRYDGGPPMFGVSLHEFRGDKVARERIYGGEAWEAPDWRAPWRSSTPADPEDGVIWQGTLTT